MMPMNWRDLASWIGLAIVLALALYNLRLCRRWIVLNMVQQDIVSGAWRYRMWVARLQAAEFQAQQETARQAWRP